MDNKNFEEQLLQMEKPKVSKLKHQDMLAIAVTNAKDNSVLSLWWLSIPLYMLAMLLMKSMFMPSTTLFSNLHEVTQQMKYSSILFFVIVPLVFMIINVVTVRKIYVYSGRPKAAAFIKITWINLLIILASIIILFIYV
jgi:hypothetical protein